MSSASSASSALVTFNAEQRKMVSDIISGVVKDINESNQKKDEIAAKERTELQDRHEKTRGEMQDKLDKEKDEKQAIALNYARMEERLKIQQEQIDRANRKKTTIPMNVDETDDDLDDSGSEFDDKEKDPNFGSNTNKNGKAKMKKSKTSNSKTLNPSDPATNFINRVAFKVKRGNKQWFRINCNAVLKGKSSSISFPLHNTNFSELCSAIYKNDPNAKINTTGIEVDFNGQKFFLPYQPKKSIEEI